MVGWKEERWVSCMTTIVAQLLMIIVRHTRKVNLNIGWMEGLR